MHYRIILITALALSLSGCVISPRGDKVGTINFDGPAPVQVTIYNLTPMSYEDVLCAA